MCIFLVPRAIKISSKPRAAGRLIKAISRAIFNLETSKSPLEPCSVSVSETAWDTTSNCSHFWRVVEQTFVMNFNAVYQTPIEEGETLILPLSRTIIQLVYYFDIQPRVSLSFTILDESTSRLKILTSYKLRTSRAMLEQNPNDKNNFVHDRRTTR